MTLDSLNGSSSKSPYFLNFLVGKAGPSTQQCPVRVKIVGGGERERESTEKPALETLLTQALAHWPDNAQRQTKNISSDPKPKIEKTICVRKTMEN